MTSVDNREKTVETESAKFTKNKEPETVNTDSTEGSQNEAARPYEEQSASDEQREPEGQIRAENSPGRLGAALDDMTLDEMMLPTNYDEIAGAQKSLATLAVRKPNAQDWVRVHPEYRGQFGFLVVKNEGSADEIYYVHRNLYEVPELARELQRREVRLAVTRKGTYLLWPLPLTDHPAHQQQTFAAEKALSSWTRIAWQKHACEYHITTATAQDLPEPIWPEESFEALCKLGFRGRMIDSLEHPVVRELLGRA